MSSITSTSLGTSNLSLPKCLQDLPDEVIVLIFHKVIEESPTANTITILSRVDKRFNSIVYDSSCLKLLKKEELNKLFLAASCSGNLKKINYLIENKADINAKDNDGQTALIAAAASDHLDTLKLLIENKAEIDAKDKRGFTALMEVAKKRVI